MAEHTNGTDVLKMKPADFFDDYSRVVMQCRALTEQRDELLVALIKYTADGECYCLDAGESKGRNPCPHCIALDTISNIKATA